MVGRRHSDAMPSLSDTVTVRLSRGDDALALERLAALDSQEAAPPSPVLLGEVNGEVWAALSLADGSVVADPFRPTSTLVRLLHVHALASERGPRASASPLRTLTGDARNRRRWRPVGR